MSQTCDGKTFTEFTEPVQSDPVVSDPDTTPVVTDTDTAPEA
jgi:hypothetical protein